MKTQPRALGVDHLRAASSSVASLVGFVAGALEPTLGLDLEGGVSVILRRPRARRRT